jgi:hypothetical protein
MNPTTRRGRLALEAALQDATDAERCAEPVAKPGESDPWLAALSDADLNRHFARVFWDRPLDERTNTYWHDDTTPDDENHEWKPLPDFVNDWSEVRKILVNSKIIVPPDFAKRTDRERNRRVMIALLRRPTIPDAAALAAWEKERSAK